MYEYSWLLAAYLKSVSRECPKTAASTTAKHASPTTDGFCRCFSRADLEMFPVCTGMVGSRAAAPFGEERICKVSVRLTSEGNLRFCPESLLHECDLSRTLNTYTSGRRNIDFASSPLARSESCTRNQCAPRNVY